MSEYYFDPEFWFRGPDDDESEIERYKAEAENQLIAEQQEEWNRQQEWEAEQEWLDRGDESEGDYAY